MLLKIKSLHKEKIHIDFYCSYFEITLPLFDPATISTQSKSDEELRAVILKGRPNTAMTGFEGAFEETQLLDLLAYIRSLASKQ